LKSEKCDKMPLQSVDTLKAHFHFKLNYYNSYLTSIEQLIDDEDTALTEHFETEVERAKEDLHLRTELDDLSKQGFKVRAEDLVYLKVRDNFERLGFYPNILRRSFFTAIFSDLLLSTLFAICRREEEKRGDLIEPFETFFKRQKNERKSDLDALREYLGQRVDSTIASYPEWADFRHYNNLRNCLVHNEGRLRKNRNKDKLKCYVEDAFPLLKWHEDIESLNDIRWFEGSPSFDWIVLAECVKHCETTQA
jgi:hypothetical protein